MANASVEKHVVGTPTRQVEGKEKVAGEAVYAADVTLPRMLWVKVLRSPIAHGRIKSIDVSEARRLTGVSTVITGRDISGTRIGKKIADMPILAEDVVRFIGEKVAAVVAESRDIAEKAVDLIRVEYEELEAVFDPLRAMQATAPLLHPDIQSYNGLLHEIETPSNVMVHLSWKKGEVDEGFKHADLIVENIFHTTLVHQAYIEPHSCVVSGTTNGGAEIWASTKAPFPLRDQVASALGLDVEKLVVHPCHVGGDFGGKGDHNDVALCILLSGKCGRPVKLVMDYGEEFSAGNPRHASVIRVKTGVKRSGFITAQHIHYVFDSGAYAAFRPKGFLVAAHAAAGPYRIPHVLIEEDYVYTNKVPCGFMRAPGETQGFFATESQMNLVAEKLGLDPADFRKQNFMVDGDELPTGGVVAHIKTEETLTRALQEAGFYGPKGNYVGRGFAVVQWVSKGGEGYAFVSIDRDGTVTVSSALMDVGTGAHTVMRQIVAEVLKVPLESVQVEALNTTSVAHDTGVRASSSTRVHGNAAFEAAKNAAQHIIRAAAEYMEVRAEELVLHNGGVTHLRAERRMTFAEIVQAKGSPIVAEGHYDNLKDGPEASVVAQVAEVEVDPDTGQIKVRRLTSAHNTGTIINPLSHQGQIDGGVVMGVGYATMEQLGVDEGGKVVTTSFGDYKIPTIQDIPPLKTVVMPTNTGSGPYRSMSIGETPIVPTAAAVANAVENAVGVRIKSLPITAEKVFEALKKRQAQSSP